MRGLLAVVVAISIGGCAGQSVDTSARVNHWVAVLAGPDAKLRKEAAFKLGNLGLSDPATVVPALTGALKDVDAGVRGEAILALLKCGTRAQEVTPVLTEMEQRDPDGQVRNYATKALQKLRNER